MGGDREVFKVAKNGNTKRKVSKGKKMQQKTEAHYSKGDRYEHLYNRQDFIARDKICDFCKKKRATIKERASNFKNSVNFTERQVLKKIQNNEKDEWKVSLNIYGKNVSLDVDSGDDILNL